MISLKTMALASTVFVAPFLVPGEAKADHWNHHRFAPGCAYDRYVPSYRSGYRADLRYRPNVGISIGNPYFGNPYFGNPYFGNPYFGVPRYGVGYPFGFPGAPIGGRGFSLYIGR